MTTFLGAAAVLVGVALAGFLFGAAARGGQSGGRALSGTNWLLLIAPVSLALAAAALYVRVERPAAVPAAAHALADAPDAAVSQAAGDLGAMTARLASRLEKQPDDGAGWALLGRAYAELRRYREAEAAFARAAALLPDDASVAADWESARRLAQGEPAAAGAYVAGTVKLAAKLGSQVAATDTVFVFARAPEGHGPPLAVMRLQAGELPANFRLDDGDAMVAGRTLSSGKDLELVARLSRTGNAMKQPGDLESRPVRTTPGATGVVLVIGE
jgi:cytochrome c-type biogenesis protein CcmH